MQAVPQRFFDGFCVEDKQPGRPQNLYLSLGIRVSNAYRRFQDKHQILFMLGANMSPCWHSKSPEILVQRVSGRLLGGRGRLQESPGEFVAVPERSGKVAAGFGAVPVRF